MKQKVSEAIRILKKGGIVIFPTDTVFGIGCRIDNEKTIERLFEIRKRPKNKPVPVLFDSIDMIKKYTKKIPEEILELMKKYLPGALTLIVWCNKEKVPALVRAGGETLGVRIPDNKILQQIISEVGKPILGPSANFSGEKTPYNFRDLDPKLVSLADYAFEGKTGSKKMASTVIDCTTKPWKIVRQGAISVSS